jgi:hypothetical protein
MCCKAHKSRTELVVVAPAGGPRFVVQKSIEMDGPRSLSMTKLAVATALRILPTFHTQEHFIITYPKGGRYLDKYRH